MSQRAVSQDIVPSSLLCLSDNFCLPKCPNPKASRTRTISGSESQNDASEIHSHSRGRSVLKNDSELATYDYVYNG